MPNLPNGTPVAKLDEAAVGRCLIIVLAASASAGHAKVWYTARDYFHEPEDTQSASSFVHDALTLEPRQAVEKWFGSELVASHYISSTLEEYVQDAPGSVTAGADPGIDR